jgi:hypothetical protein
MDVVNLQPMIFVVQRSASVPLGAFPYLGFSAFSSAVGRLVRDSHLLHCFLHHHLFFRQLRLCKI